MCRSLGHLKPLIKNQTIASIMRKMPQTDWKQWATSRPEWMWEEIEEAFERFVEQKWREALPVAAAELVSWKATGARPKKSTAKMQTGNSKKTWVAGGSMGVATIEAATGDERRRRCQFFHSLGYDKSHPAFNCELLKELKTEAKKKPSV